MSIRPGEPWGAPVPPSADTPVATTDAELAALVAARWTDDHPAAVGPFILTGGDLHRTLGAPRRQDPHGQDLVEFTCDVVGVTASSRDGSTLRFLAVAHVVGLPAGRRRGMGALWRGTSFVAANAAFLGEANIGPRAHPGDGRVDVTSGRLGGRDRRTARRRVLTGSHLPHPDLDERRAHSWSADPDAWFTLVVDGVDRGEARDVCLTVTPDAMLVRV